MEHWQRQKLEHDAVFAASPRPHVATTNPVVRYVSEWRMKEGVRRLQKASNGRLTQHSSILVMCSGLGFEGSFLCDIGYQNVTVSDISDIGVQEATRGDHRLKGLTLNAENVELPDRVFDVVIVQDGLHHLQSPVRGFTEMLRIAKVGVMFLEPHDSLVGNLIGTKWEKNGEAINYVFRWTSKLVEDVTSSYLGEGNFRNLSFSFWHHYSLVVPGKLLGGGIFAATMLGAAKSLLDFLLGRWGNQFCGLVVRK